MKKIGLLVIATGKYDVFVPQLLESAHKWFLKDHKVIFFLFTDSNIDPGYPDCRKIPTMHRSWPYPTLLRYEVFVNHKDLLSDMDYLFYCDVDMRFVDTVSNEILGERVGTLHPGYVGRRGTPETRPESLACVYPHEKMQYFAGGFNGGSSEEFLRMAAEIDARIKDDLLHSVVAVWHDESHLNRFFIDNPPTVVLDPGYCYPESWKIPYSKKLLALDKDHAKMRSDK